MKLQTYIFPWKKNDSCSWGNYETQAVNSEKQLKTLQIHAESRSELVAL